MSHVWSDRSTLVFQRPTMRFTARTFIAANLAAMLAALACFEHVLHELSHRRAALAACLPELGESCVADGCCSHQHHDSADSPGTKPEWPSEHDPDNCVVCRFLALPQLCEAPQELLSAERLVAEVVGLPQPAFASRLVALVPIRGPPLS